MGNKDLKFSEDDHIIFKEDRVNSLLEYMRKKKSEKNVKTCIILLKFNNKSIVYYAPMHNYYI